MNQRARKIVVAQVKRWDGLCPGVPYGLAYEFDDGVEGGVAVGTKSEAQRLADEAVGKGDEFIASLRNSAAARLPE